MESQLSQMWQEICLHFGVSPGFGFSLAVWLKFNQSNMHSSCVPNHRQQDT